MAGTSGSGAVGPSTALVPLDPLSPQPTAAPAHPLGRSGIDLLDILATTDAVATRGPTGAVALEVGLEHARGALLRNLPGDALAALDGVWERARKTEEGWYLRSGALTVLGLPGECDRVAEEGLTLRPTSVALRFVQSVARLALGDIAGARHALAPAMQRADADPLLRVQQALTEARQGDERGANAVLQQLERTAPDHPAVLWGRNALRALVAEATRSRSRPTPSDWPSAVDDTGVDDAARARTPSTPLASIETATRETTSDPASAALERFGARVALRPAAEVAREARMLLRAFSAGGSLAAATTPEQAHAARIVLTTFLAVAANEHGEVPSPVRTMVEQITPLLQRGRPDEADRVVRRQSVMAREPIGRLLLAVVRGAALAGARVGEMLSDAGAIGVSDAGVIDATLQEADLAEPTRAAGTTAGKAPADACVSAPSLRHTPFRGVPVLGELLVRDAVDRGPVVPIRLGLSLLEETAGQRAALQGASGAWPAMVSNSPRDLTEIFPTSGESNGAPRNPESEGAGWGAAHAARTHGSAAEWSDGAGARIVALLCVALAMGSLVTGHGAIAIGLGIGAAWMGLRKSGSRQTHGTHEGGGSQ